MWPIICILIILLVVLPFFGFPVCVFFVVFGRQNARIRADVAANKDFSVTRGGIGVTLPDGMRKVSRERTLTADDGVTLKAEYFDRGSGKTALLAHGYRANPLRNFARLTVSLLSRGYNVLWIYQRAHGRSGGKFTSLGEKEAADLLRWIAWADAMPGTEEILVYGTSMGGTAVGMASDKIPSEKVRALVIDCGYTCFEDLFRNGLRKKKIPPFLLLPGIKLLVKAFVRASVSASAEKALAACTIPTLFVYGTADETVPPELVKRNYDACSAEKALITAKGAGHARAFSEGGEAIEREFYGFVETYMSASAGGGETAGAAEEKAPAEEGEQ